MAAWIFQARPERYKLEEKLQVDTTETWLVTRYRKEMSRGDIVFFWRAGDRQERGLYGWGRIIDDEATNYKGWGWGIKVVYSCRFENFIPVDEIEREGILDNNLILRMPAGTNFKVTDEELRQLSEMIQLRGEEVPSSFLEENGP